MKRELFFLVSLFVLLSFVVSNVRFNPVEVKASNGSPVHNLDTGLNYTSIQEALDASETGDGHTILVDANTYYEHVIVNKSISLVGQDRSTTIIDGSGNGTVVTIMKDNVNVTGFTIQNSGEPERGFYLDNVNHCNITGNEIRNNQFGMRIWNSSNNNTISGNNITGNIAGIYLISGSSNTITRNNMFNNGWCISLYDSSNNTISGNNLFDNNLTGISFYPYSSNNTISGNNIAGNYEGFYLDSSSNNSFYQNNIIDNLRQVRRASVFSSNVWDNGVEGNYWSNYTGADLLDGGDGIGDSPHNIDDDNTDRFPLMGPISFFDAGIWEDTNYYVQVISNSTLSDFSFDPDAGPFIQFWVTGENETQETGFCRVAIPKDVLWVDDGWTVFYGSWNPSYTAMSDEDFTYLYFTYENPYIGVQTEVNIYGTHVIPEFPSLILLSLFLLGTLLVATFYRRKNKDCT